jgi:hypothetical protein
MPATIHKTENDYELHIASINRTFHFATLADLVAYAVNTRLELVHHIN